MIGAPLLEVKDLRVAFGGKEVVHGVDFSIQPGEKLALVGVEHELYFYTPGVTTDQLGCLGSRLFTDIDRAVAAVLEGVPPGARVVLVPDGPYAYARAVPAYV